MFLRTWFQKTNPNFQQRGYSFICSLLIGLVMSGCLHSPDAKTSLTFNPSILSVASNSLTTMTAVGGSTPYTYSLVNGGGSISSSGVFTAPATSGTSLLSVKDSSGNTAYATVTVTPALTITPAFVTINLNGIQQFTVSGGTAPYVYLLLSGVGSVTTTGLYTAPSVPGTAKVRVVDNNGNYQDANITVWNGPQISPTTLSLAVNSSYTFTASTGIGPYTYAVVSGSGSVVAATGVFTAPASPGTSVVQVTDSQGYTSSAVVTVINPTKLMLSQGYTCALKPDGTVKCWGAPFNGSLGSSTFFPSVGASPNQMGDNLLTINLGTGLTATALFSSLGYYHSCVILNTGNVKCWGSNNAGQLGLGDTIFRGYMYHQMGDYLGTVSFGGGLSVTSMAMGLYDVCAISNAATLKCWGYNGWGQLGQNNFTQLNSVPASTVFLGAGRTAAAVAAGGNGQYCVILDNAQVKCWGQNNVGQLGYQDIVNRGGNAGDMTALGYVNLGTGRTATAIAGGANHFCAILDNTQVKCWGLNTSGQLGQGDLVNRGDSAVAGHQMGDSLAYINLGTGRTAVAIAAGGAHTCALLDNGTMKCWGSNGFGQLGYGDTVSRGSSSAQMGDSLPVVNVGGGTISKMVLGSNHTCVLLTTNTVKCWGYNVDGELGIGTFVSKGITASDMGASLQTVNVGTGRTVLGLSAGGTYNCVLMDNLQIKCWGNRFWGNLGDEASIWGVSPNQMGNNLAPIDLGTGRTAVALATTSGQSVSHACAILDNSTLKCWGYNGNGQLGLGNTLNVGVYAGQMGNGLSNVNLGVRTPKAVSIGPSHTCVLLDDSSVQCWGDNSQGQLGIDSTASSNGPSGIPINLGPGRSAKMIAASYYSNCALLDNNQVKCWGYNSTGQLGTQDLISRGNSIGSMAGLAYVNLGTGRTATSIVGGGQFYCAILDNAGVKCWGLNSSGQLGDGDVVNRGGNVGDMGDSLPYVALGTGRTAVALTAGQSHVCALLDNNSIKCWGSAGQGQLGYGNTVSMGSAFGQMGDTLMPVDLGASTPVSVTAGYLSTCGVMTDGAVKCWGYNNDGELGLGHNLNIGTTSGQMGANLQPTSL